MQFIKYYDLLHIGSSRICTEIDYNGTKHFHEFTYLFDIDLEIISNYEVHENNILQQMILINLN